MDVFLLLEHGTKAHSIRKVLFFSWTCYNSVKGAEDDLKSKKGEKALKRLFKTNSSKIVGNKNGPKIMVKNLNKKRKKGEKRTLGVYDGGDVIYLDKLVVKMAEAGDKKAQKLLERTIVHEVGHWAERKINKRVENNRTEEKGVELEKRIYGKKTDYYNNDGKPNQPYSEAAHVHEKEHNKK